MPPKPVVLDEKINTILARLEALDDISNNVEAIQKDLKSYNQKNEELEKKFSVLQLQVSSQQKVIHNLEVQLKKRNLTFAGLATRNKSIQEIELQLRQILKEYLNIHIESHDIDDIRLIDKPENENRRIIVSFSSAKIRNAVLQNRRLFKGSKIFANEDLTHKALKERKELLSEQKKYKEQGIATKIIRNKLVVLNSSGPGKPTDNVYGTNTKRNFSALSEDSTYGAKQPAKQQRHDGGVLQGDHSSTTPEFSSPVASILDLNFKVTENDKTFLSSTPNGSK